MMPTCPDCWLPYPCPCDQVSAALQQSDGTRLNAGLSGSIRKRAQKAQRDGNAGAAVKLHILASEAKTVRER